VLLTFRAVDVAFRFRSY